MFHKTWKHVKIFRDHVRVEFRNPQGGKSRRTEVKSMYYLILNMSLFSFTIFFYAPLDTKPRASPGALIGGEEEGECFAALVPLTA